MGRARSGALLAAARPRLALLLLRLHGGARRARGWPGARGIPGWAAPARYRPALRGSAASATCAGNLTSCRSLDVTARRSGSAPHSPRCAGRGPHNSPGAPGPRRNPRPAGGGNDSRLESSIAPAAATHRAGGGQSHVPAVRLHRARCSRSSASPGSTGGKLRQEGGEVAPVPAHGSGQLVLARQTRAVFFLAMQLVLILYGVR